MLNFLLGVWVRAKPPYPSVGVKATRLDKFRHHGLWQDHPGLFGAYSTVQQRLVGFHALLYGFVIDIGNLPQLRRRINRLSTSLLDMLRFGPPFGGRKKLGLVGDLS